MDKYVINVPKTVENDLRGLSFLTSLFSETAGYIDRHIELDFIRTRWFEANLASILGAWIELKLLSGCTIYFSNLTTSIENVFKKNGFYEKYNLGTIHDLFDSTIKYKVFSVTEEDEFSKYVSEKVITKIRLNISNPVMKSFKLSLNEIFINVKLHAKSDKVFTCGQYYHTHRKVAFTITDLGNTIGYNVRENFCDPMISDCNAIEWATQYGNTTKEDTEVGGIGLHIIDEFLTGNNGVFQIISGNGYWENSEGEVYKVNLDYYFPGTIVNIISKLENTFSWNNEILF